MQNGDKVKWKWGDGHAEGKVIKIFEERVTRMLGGSEITREGSKSNPALLIQQEDGAQVLKLQSEVQKM